MNTLAVNTIDIGTTPPLGRTLGAYLAETRYEFMRMVRNPAVAIPVLVLPFALYALFALVVTAEAIKRDPGIGVFLFAAFSLMSVTMPALFGIGVTLAQERDMGLLKLKRAQPAPPAAWVVAKLVTGFVLAVLAYLPIAAIALFTGKVALAPAQIAALSGALLVGSIPFCALGLMIGSLVSGSAAPAYANLVYLPGCYLSGLFFPLPESIPWLQWQAKIWPQYHVEHFAIHAAGITKWPNLEPVQTAIAAMLVYTLLFAGVTIWRLKRKG